MKAKKMVGTAIEVLMGAVVLVFLGMKSIDFFMFTTPPDQWYYSYLGFAMTGLGAVGYLVIFMTVAETDLKKVVSVAMMIVCFIGEVATAGFGMQIEAWHKSGWEFSQSDVDFMILAVQVLAFLHALALVAYVAGDKIGELLADRDGDGIPDKLQRKQQPTEPMRAYNAELAELEMRLEELRQNPPNLPTK